MRAGVDRTQARMHTSIRRSPLFAILSGLLVGLLAGLLPGQFPTDEEVKKQIWNDKVLEIRFPKRTRGEKVWDGATNSWYWQRGLVVVRNAGLKEYPKARVEIGGLARYFITGEKVSYQKFLVTWNEFKGIPVPTHKDTVAMVKSRLRQFVGNYRYQKIVGKVEDLGIAKDHRTEWHTPHSFSINVSCRFSMIVSYTEVEETAATFRVRFYRDGFGKPWKERIVSTLKKQERGEKTKYDIDYVKRLPTLGSLEREREVRAARASLPKVEVPKFTTDQQLFQFVYKLLREGDPKQLEAALLQCMAPHCYADVAKRMLNRNGARLINNAALRAYKGKSTYKENYGPEMNIKRRQKGMVEVWNRTRQVKTRIAARQVADPQTGERSWRLTALDPWTLTRPADIANLRRK